MVPLCVLASILLLLAPYIIPHYMAVEPELAERAGFFAIILIPSLWTLSAFRVLQKYLQSQNIMKPSMFAGVLGIMVNFVVNLIFVFGAQGGYVGCAFGMFLTRMILLLWLLRYVYMHPSIDVSINLWQAAVGVRDIMTGVVPRSALFFDSSDWRQSSADDGEETSLLTSSRGDQVPSAPKSS